MASTAFYVVAEAELFFPQSGSLKAKRADLNRVKAALRDRSMVGVAEVGYQETWQRSLLALSFCCGSQIDCERRLSKIHRELEELVLGAVTINSRLLSWDDIKELP